MTIFTGMKNSTHTDIKNELSTRIKTAVLLVIVASLFVVPAFFYEGLRFLLLIPLLTIVAGVGVELRQLLAKGHVKSTSVFFMFTILSVCSVLLLYIDDYYTPQEFYQLILSLLCLLPVCTMGVVFLIERHDRTALFYELALLLPTSFLYLSGTLALVGLVCSNMPVTLFLWYVSIVIASDTGAYFFGKKFGKHSLSPVLSPGKTVEGAFGAMFSSVIVGLLLSIFTNFSSPFFVIAAAILISLFVQCGDLAKSLIKRTVGVKDSGTLLPGHGGFLDRFDGFLCAGNALFAVVNLSILI